MQFDSRNRPINLSDLTKLVIDRKRDKGDFSLAWPTICLSLDRTLFYTIKSVNTSGLPEDWLKNSVEVVYEEEGAHERCLVLSRPGVTELLIEIRNHACRMIYSSESDAFIEAVMLALSIAQGDPDSEDCFQEADAFMDIPTWSRRQCIATEEGYKKSLATLSELSDNGINDIWLIDDRPDLVDFPSHVLAVPSFFGDPDDRALFRVIDEIFIN